MKHKDNLAYNSGVPELSLTIVDDKKSSVKDKLMIILSKIMILDSLLKK